MTRNGLAVLTPFVGLQSETFVQRHVTELAPGATLTVSTRMGMPGPATWEAPGPSIVLDGDRHPPGLRWFAMRVAGRLRGSPAGRWRWRPSTRDLDVLAGAFDEAGVTVVLAEFLDVWLPLLPWLQARGLRVYPHAHGYDISVRLRHPWWRDRYRAYAAADGVIVVSEVARERLEAVGIDRGRIHVIPCGVDADPMPSTPLRRDTVDVVAVGRMVPKKHPLLTVEAFRLAAARDPRLRLTMVGDGPLLPAVRAAVAGDERVRLLGALPHEQALAAIRAGDLFVQHSVVDPINGDEEGLPVGLLEAMAAGRPVVSTRHAGIPEAVDEDVTGLLVDEGDVLGMADAIVDLASDRARRLALGRAGHARAIERFSWERERRELRALLGLDVEARV